MKPQHLAAAIACLPLIACDGSDEVQRIVGQLESDRVEITAEVQEPITEKMVAEGQTVVAGDALIQQTTQRIEAVIAEAEAALGQSRARLDELIRGPRKELIIAARANVDGAQHEEEFRIAEFDRAQELLNKELTSPTFRDSAKAALDTATANLQVQRAQFEQLLSGTTIEELQQAEEAVKQAIARIDLLNIDLDRHRSTAPVNGIVDSILFEPGERPGPGQPLLILLTGQQPYARVYIPASLRATTVPGMAARIYVDGINSAFDGRVRWVSSEAAFTPYFALTEHDRGRLSYLAKIDLVDAVERLPDGVPVEVELLP
jgi:HlyD family secretion protein